MSTMKEKVKEYLDSCQYNYKFDEEKEVFRFLIVTGTVLGNLEVYIVPEENCLLVYTYLNSQAEVSSFAVVAEYLHRANYGLKNGNFEIDYRERKIRYKTFTNVKNTDVSKEVIEESIFMGVNMMQVYGKGLLTIMLGETTPEEMINEIEKTDISGDPEEPEESEE